ncbi:uncharacterized protein CIMG_05386 [Coccidioides immitis RS]|uniref:NF-kappa-B inhibitor-like protein 1 n=1 Tax=Coccidioides immitis (strain RS) TaxID=246410 RepID=J3KFG2_COCIM|nr:uncharacterized protein CIMG_05386 [Coccidioides immitis RS]EAS34362.3 hypothetical protein CIMG_05386 [Coccidioides immitis RS]TPX21818.1 hypothetical protein DIZ76_015782 [Coccidioides immitis]
MPGDHGSQHEEGRKTTSTKSDDDYSTGRRKFRLKSKHSSKREQDHEKSRKRRSHHSSDGQRCHKHRKSSRGGETFDERPLSPNAAFRESLFDALADDEGAAYWESVYGQPIHTYPRPEQADCQGDLERMTDEEYASYVRARMWEKTHQAVLEERERRRRAREAEMKAEKARREQRKAEPGREAFEKMIDESLRRGRDRKERKRKASLWADVWSRYLESWKELDTLAREAASKTEAASPDSFTLRLRNLIVWPVETGKRKDVTPQTIEEFIRNAPFQQGAGASASTSSQETGSASPHYPDLITALKMERVRWHPDKIKHRYGILGMEEQVDKSATEVFQILDRMWVEERAKYKLT